MLSLFTPVSSRFALRSHCFLSPTLLSLVLSLLSNAFLLFACVAIILLTSSLLYIAIFAFIFALITNLFLETHRIPWSRNPYT